MRAAAVVLVLATAILVRSLLAAEGWGAAIVSVLGVGFFLVAFARLDDACSYPFRATSKVIAFVACFPWLWADVGRGGYGLATGAMAIFVLGVAISRGRNAGIAGSASMGLAAGLVGDVLLALPWLLYRWRWRKLAGFVLGVVPVFVLVWLARPPAEASDFLARSFVAGALLEGARWEPGGLALVAKLFTGGSREMAPAVWGAIAATVLSAALVFSWQKLPGLQLDFGTHEVGGMLALMALIAPWGGPPLGVFLFVPLALASEAAVGSSSRALERAAVVAVGVAAVASWGSFAAEFFGDAAPIARAVCRSLAAAALVVPVVHPSFHPTILPTR
ncbi:MAG TPA: hypothetical protein VK116_13985 [Planctomycetota bacterium]|nr:hypothetical protein [Planctomycetota bacterium]